MELLILNICDSFSRRLKGMFDNIINIWILYEAFIDDL